MSHTKLSLFFFLSCNQFCLLLCFSLFLTYVCFFSACFLIFFFAFCSATSFFSFIFILIFPFALFSFLTLWEFRGPRKIDQKRNWPKESWPKEELAKRELAKRGIGQKRSRPENEDENEDEDADEDAGEDENEDEDEDEDEDENEDEERERDGCLKRWGSEGWGWERRVEGEGGENFALFFYSPDPLFVFSSQFPKFFVELRWSLRVCNVEHVFTTSCETPAAFGAAGASQDVQRTANLCVVETCSTLQTRRNHRNSTKNLGTWEEKTKRGSGEEKKSAKFWPPTLRPPPPSLPHSGSHLRSPTLRSPHHPSLSHLFKHPLFLGWPPTFWPPLSGPHPCCFASSFSFFGFCPFFSFGKLFFIFLPLFVFLYSCSNLLFFLISHQFSFFLFPFSILRFCPFFFFSKLFFLFLPFPCFSVCFPSLCFCLLFLLSLTMLSIDFPKCFFYIWPNLVLAKLGLAKLGLGQTWSWPNLVWPNLVLAKLGLAKLGLGQTWFGQTWSWPNLVWPNLVTKLGQTWIWPNLVSPVQPPLLGGVAPQNRSGPKVTRAL